MSRKSLHNLESHVANSQATITHTRIHTHTHTHIYKIK